MGAHLCHARQCEVQVPPRMFMCRHHWFMVPMDLRCRILAAYQPGQEKLDGTSFPSDEYLDLTREARRIVHERETVRD